MLQFLFALAILRWETGKAAVGCLGDKIERLFLFTDEGSGFVFGYLVHRRPFIPQLLPEDSLARNVTEAVSFVSYDRMYMM